jgi:outer membrane protein W
LIFNFASIKNNTNFSFMKRSKLKLFAFSALALAAASGLFSCSKSSSTASPYVMSATKGGATTSFSGQTMVIAFSMGTMLEIEGEAVSNGDTTGYIFMLNNYSGPGSYTLDGTTNIGEWVNKSATTATVLLAANGNITIKTAASPTMTGTFYFTATDSTKISNGTFTAKF